MDKSTKTLNKLLRQLEILVKYENKFEMSLSECKALKGAGFYDPASPLATMLQEWMVFFDRTFLETVDPIRLRYEYSARAITILSQGQTVSAQNVLKRLRGQCVNYKKLSYIETQVEQIEFLVEHGTLNEVLEVGLLVPAPQLTSVGFASASGLYDRALNARKLQAEAIFAFVDQLLMGKKENPHSVPVTLRMAQTYLDNYNRHHFWMLNDERAKVFLCAARIDFLNWLSNTSSEGLVGKSMDCLTPALGLTSDFLNRPIDANHSSYEKNYPSGFSSWHWNDKKAYRKARVPGVLLTRMQSFNLKGRLLVVQKKHADAVIVWKEALAVFDTLSGLAKDDASIVLPTAEKEQIEEQIKLATDSQADTSAT